MRRQPTHTLDTDALDGVRTALAGGWTGAEVYDHVTDWFDCVEHIEGIRHKSLFTAAGSVFSRRYIRMSSYTAVMHYVLASHPAYVYAESSPAHPRIVSRTCCGSLG